MGCGCTVPRVTPSVSSRSVSVVRLRARARSMTSQISSYLGINKLHIHWPFDEKEVLTIIQTWEIVRKNLDKKGADMFAKMFQQNPNVKRIFEKFNTLDTSSRMALRSDILYIHGMTVMNAIDDVMCNLDERNVAIDMLLEQGQSHAHFGEHFNETVFWAIHDPFLCTVQESLGRRYKNDVKEMYTKAINFIIHCFIQGFSEARKQAATRSVAGYDLPAETSFVSNKVNDWLSEPIETDSTPLSDEVKSD